MLSAQTKDPVTANAMSELKKLPLTIDNFLNAKDEDLEKMIYPVSFYKVIFYMFLNLNINLFLF